MKHVPRRRLLANFFLLPIYLILLYICSFAIPIHQLIQSSYIINIKNWRLVYVHLISIKHILFIWCESVAQKFSTIKRWKKKSLMAAMMYNLSLWVTIAIFVMALIICCLFVIFESCTIHDDGDDGIPHMRWDQLMLWFVSQVGLYIKWDM